MGPPVARQTLIKLPSLAYYRIRRGWTQAQLAEAAGTSRVNVGRIETNHETRPTMARKLADALGVDIDTLMRHPPADE
jgi:transcriptional regulator with XRE-family HTH domain